MTIIEKLIEEINNRYGENAEYILNDYDVKNEIGYLERRAVQNDEKSVEWAYKRVLNLAENFNNNRLTPATVKVGDGATIVYWSDRHAGTVIKKTKCSITIQRDKATLDPNFKPEFITGGFAAHCTNQDEQTYTYEKDENGSTYTFRWSKKRNRYQQGGSDYSIRAIKGRHEFYDYNF